MNLSLLLTAAETTAAAAENTAAKTDNGNIFGVVLIAMLVAFGIYCIYAALRLHFKCELFPSKVIYPGNCTPDTCTDPDGYLRFTAPRLLGMGVILALAGIVKALNDYVFLYKAGWVYYAELAVPILVFSWYMVIQNRSAKKFWS